MQTSMRKSEEEVDKTVEIRKYLEQMGLTGQQLGSTVGSFTC